ncbi:hypothetical protein GCM10025771_12160 [Niveibacterium umoris]|uniref:DNA-binding transcriptional LysR family regulator n=1 Tax=Niveibacterium umoris TaxID=1193620 RepID=A0A840BP22_9RHOO|nr:LysR family transcriptional regulator [Niveibacterium umoris]MBB4013229.1 DNA-binding transcriptional LysR family regulator [Niveibacterium umoris]
MDLADLRLFLAATRHPSLQAAASEQHLTPSALSKAIRRLEEDLRTPLFDRQSKSLRLNAAGERLRQRALDLVHLAEQTRAEFEGADFRVHCRVAAPAVLQWRWGAAIARALSARFPDSSLALRPVFEDEALAALARGDADFACVTGKALQGSNPRHWRSDFAAVSLGTIRMQLAAGAHHPLAQRAPGLPVTASTAEVLAHPFACPSRSLFCGVQRGSRSDGWRDDRLPRAIRYWVDDLQVLVSLVIAGEALAYLPDFALQTPGLVHVSVSDCPYTCEESVWLVWRPTAAAGWQQHVVDALATMQGDVTPARA